MMMEHSKFYELGSDPLCVIPLSVGTKDSIIDELHCTYLLTWIIFSNIINQHNFI
jgi:hypothetical protein